MNCPLGSPVAVNGLKFLTNVTSPEPVMTRQRWLAALSARPWWTAAGLCTAAVAVATTVATAAHPATAAAGQRVERRLRRIGCPFSPGAGANAERWLVRRKRFRKRLPRLR